MKQSCVIYKYVLIRNLLYATQKYIKMKKMELFPLGALTKQLCLLKWRQTEPAHNIRPLVHKGHVYLLPGVLGKLSPKRWFPNAKDLTCRQSFQKEEGAEQTDWTEMVHLWIRICNGWEHTGLLGMKSKIKQPLSKCAIQLTSGSQLCLTIYVLPKPSNEELANVPL